MTYPKVRIGVCPPVLPSVDGDYVQRIRDDALAGFGKCHGCPIFPFGHTESILGLLIKIMPVNCRDDLQITHCALHP